MIENNNLNEEQLTKVAGGTEESEKLHRAKYIIEECKRQVDFLCSQQSCAKYEAVQKLEHNVNRAYNYSWIHPSYDLCLSHVKNAINRVDPVIAVLPAYYDLYEIKELLLNAKEVLVQNQN